MFSHDPHVLGSTLGIPGLLGRILYDLIYNPDQTLFLKKGKEQGALTKNGLEMLLLQAFASWDFWTGEEKK